MPANSLAPLQTEAFLTPVAFQGLYEKGLVVAPNQEHIARMGQIIGEELPDYALPAEASELAVIIRGSTKKDDTAKLLERDVRWPKATPSQVFFPTSGLESSGTGNVLPVTKGDIAQAGRFIMEFSCVNPGLWRADKSKRSVEFALQWTARRALSSVAENVPHEVKGAFSDFPIFGSRDRKRSRILDAITDEELDPFHVSRRRSVSN